MKQLLKLLGGGMNTDDLQSVFKWWNDFVETKLLASEIVIVIGIETLNLRLPSGRIHWFERGRYFDDKMRSSWTYQASNLSRTDVWRT